jgi:hypothetical protein
MERIQNGRLIPLISAVVLALSIPLIVLPREPAFAQAKTSPSVKKSFKRLKGRIAQLEQRVETLSKERGPEGPSGPAGPQGPVGPQGPATGPAGGGLTGMYPNPLIAPNAVGSAEIADDAVSRPEIGHAAVGSDEIADHSIFSSDLAGGDVGGAALGRVFTVVSPGTIINQGFAGRAFAQCPGQTLLLAGGYAWEKEKETSIVFSTPNQDTPRSVWSVQGMAIDGNNRLYAWASCLEA